MQSSPSGPVARNTSHGLSEPSLTIHIPACSTSNSAELGDELSVGDSVVDELGVEVGDDKRTVGL